MSHLLGIDVGTSGTKALICDFKGKVIATAGAEYDMLMPKPGWTEQRPDDWWAGAVKATRAVMKKAKLKPDQIKGVGLSGQMHGSVFLDKSGKPIRNALLWNDQRTAKQSDDILKIAGGPKRMLELVGNLPLTGYTVPKILWLLENEPKNYARIAKIILPKDYIRLKMTGEYATDVADASGTALLDIKTRQWSDELLGLLGIDKTFLPTLYESPDITGTITASAAKKLGLAAGTIVIAGAGDVASGTVGNGVVEGGLVAASLGTSGVMCAHADTPAIDDADPNAPGRVATMCGAVPGKWITFGCMLSAAGAFQWYADQLAQHEVELAKKQKRNVFEVMTEMAAEAPMGSEGLFFMPHLTGERCPYPDPNARACWIGMTLRTTKAMCIRALMEGVTFNMNAMLDIMRDHLHISAKQVRATGGGAKSKLWKQMQADIYGAPLAVTNSEEGGAYGVALLAGVGAGVWPSIEAACRATIKTTEVTKPNAKRVADYGRRGKVYGKLYGDLRERFGEIAALDS
jgi:xylulokinase